MKKKKAKKESKTIKIGPYKVKVALIEEIIGIILLIIFFTSPKVALIVTQKYNSGTEEQNNSVRITFGENNTEERFKQYFWWYNVMHEVGHGLINYNSNKKFSGPEEEQIVNDFAYAYWAYYGGQEELDKVEEIINYAYDHIQNEEGRKMDYMEYAKKNWYKNSFYTFDKYGYFQFSSVKETYKNKKDLKTVLDEMGIKNANLTDNKVLKYNTLDKETVDKIIEDAVNNIHSWGLEYPEVSHKYTNNPYYSHFRPLKKAILPFFSFGLSD